MTGQMQKKGGFRLGKTNKSNKRAPQLNNKKKTESVVSQHDKDTAADVTREIPRNTKNIKIDVKENDGGCSVVKSGAERKGREGGSRRVGKTESARHTTRRRNLYTHTHKKKGETRTRRNGLGKDRMKGNPKEKKWGKRRRRAANLCDVDSFFLLFLLCFCSHAKH